MAAATVRSDGATTLDVRLILKTRDDARSAWPIDEYATGRPTLSSASREAKSSIPQRTISASPPSSRPRYEWINCIVAVGIGHSRADGPVYSVFEVL